MGDFMMNNLGRESTILISLSMILFAGFIVTRLTKRLRLPNVSGYILAGLLIGPSVLRIVPQSVINDMDFLSDIALAFIAFGVGQFFKKEVIGSGGMKVLVIALVESLLPAFLVTAVMRFLFQMDWGFSILLGAVAAATAPASTMMSIKQYGAKGHFIDVLLQVVALDDVIALLAFGIASAFLQAEAGGSGSLAAIMPIVNNCISAVLGILSGIALNKCINENRSNENKLIIPIALLLGLSGACNMMDVSPLLACMVFGGVYINMSGNHEVFVQVDGFSPPILSCFFILSGMRLNVAALKSCGIIGIVYFIIRIVGKYAGAYVGAKLAKEDGRIQKYLGLALVPQAGVAIGLAFLGRRILPAGVGDTMANIILASSFLYELAGPICAKTALTLSGAIAKDAPARLKTAEADRKLLAGIE